MGGAAAQTPWFLAELGKQTLPDRPEGGLARWQQPPGSPFCFSLYGRLRRTALWSKTIRNGAADDPQTLTKNRFTRV